MYNTALPSRPATALFDPVERAFATAVSDLTYCNPFLPERIAAERAALGAEFVESDCDWNRHPDSKGQHSNISRLTERATALAHAVRNRLATHARPGERDLRLYEDLVLFTLYHHSFEPLTGVISEQQQGGRQRVGFYAAFLEEASHFLDIPGVRLPAQEPPAHLFACFFQIRRAFHHIFTHIIGGSAPACSLRAAAWQSIFTHDLARYRRALYRRMGDITTLITGPSGTGKELVARAIGLSRYIPFDAKTQAFSEDSAASFHALSLTALSPTLIESELFGHRRGSFTGALEDRAGWLEVCPALGTVFLDEVGEVDPPIQVKLLRVLQTRTFQRLGDTRTQRFQGKIIAATHRNLAQEMRDGHFREDFYYRLCSDQVTTPSLYELLDNSVEELHGLIRFIAHRIAGDDEAPDLAREVQNWIDRHLPRDYRWPGNFRELEQCVRNVLVRGDYHPAAAAAPAQPADDIEHLCQAIRATTLSADELIERYCTLVYAQTHSYEETARRLSLDRRTVKSRVRRHS
jgi:transcriptional regulator with AAA-type ATPase domain